MNRTLVVLALLVGLATSSSYGLASGPEGLGVEEDASNRLFFVNTNTTQVTVGYSSFIIGATAVLVLGALAALSYFYATGSEDSGYSGYSGYSGSGSGSGYDRYSTHGRKASFDPYSIDWEKFSILDWISIGQEAYDKFDPADADCQLRLICELHQNTSKFGLAAQKMVDVFSYLQFTEVLSLPDEIKVLVEEWLNAADMGRNKRKECGEIFQTCDFSVNSMVDKYTHNGGHNDI